MLGKIEGMRRSRHQRIKWLDGITDSMDINLASSGSWWWTGKPGMLQIVGSQRVKHNWATELNWTRRHLHCFQGLAIMNKAIVNTCVQVFLMDIHFQFLWLNTKKCDGWIIWQEYNSFYKKPQNCLPNWLCHFAFSPEMNESSCYSIPSLAFCIIKCSKFWPFK